MGNNQPKISVIMPVYNASRYLGESLGNVVRQTFSDIEIICVDDGSTDDSLDTLRRYENEDDRIRVISREHTNAGTARNIGLAEAKGEYLSFLDADDIFELDMLAKAYEAATTKRADIVVYRSDRYNEARGAYEEARWTIKSEFLPEQYHRGECFSHRVMDDILYCFASGWAWDKLFRADYIRSQGLEFQEQPWINDRYFVMCAIAAAERIYVIDDVLVHKRVNNRGSLTTDYVDGGKWKYLCECLVEIKNWLEGKDLWRICRADFSRFSALHLRWNLDRFIDEHIFSEIYKETKRKYFEDLGLMYISETEKEDSPETTWLREVYNEDSDTYRFRHRLTRREGTYLFPFELVNKGSHIVLYGAGAVGQEYYRQIKYSRWCEIAAWVDEDPRGKSGLVLETDRIDDVKYDSLIIAIRDQEISEQIKSVLIRRGVSVEKIIWRAPEIELQ